jgi:hypothetical protein
MKRQSFSLELDFSAKPGLSQGLLRLLTVALLLVGVVLAALVHW